MTDEKVRAFGETLRVAREAAGLSIAELSATTRISARYLTALEGEDWAVVPPAVIGRGFVRVVSREVGVDADELLSAYERARGMEDQAPSHHLPEADWRVDLRAGRRQRSLLVLVGIMLLVLCAGVWLWPQATVETELPAVAVAPSGGPAETPAAQADPQPAAQPEPPPAAHAEGAEPAPSAAPAVPGPVTLKIRAVEEVWVRVVTDGGAPRDRTLQPGEERSYRAEESVRVRLGNAGNVRLYWNDTALKLPGERGQVVTLQFPEAFESLRP